MPKCKLKCRVWTKEVYRKNYKTSHPSQNCEDLSSLGQSKITSLFKPVPPPKPTYVVDEEIELSLVEGQSKKRRHEIGESVDLMIPMWRQPLVRRKHRMMM